MLYEYRSTSCDPDHSAVGESARARSQGNHDRQKGPDGKIGFVLLYGPASQRDSWSEAPAGPAGCHARVFILETLCYLNQMECFAPSANEPA